MSTRRPWRDAESEVWLTFRGSMGPATVAHVPPRVALSRVVSIAFPVALQSLLIWTLALIDQLMVGQIGAAAVASAGIGVRVTMLVSVVVTALSTSVGAFTAQFAATDQIGQVRAALRHTNLGATCIAAPVVLVGMIEPTLLIRPFSADPQLDAEGAPYLRLVALGVLPTTIIIVCTAIMRSLGRTRLPLSAAAAAIAVNLCLDWVFISVTSGPLGWASWVPAWGPLWRAWWSACSSPSQ